MSDADAPPQETPKPRRRWKRWVFGLLVALAGLLVWANGPGIRWAIEKVISQQLETQKLSGTFEIQGTALTGLAIHNLSLTGESKIQNIKSDLLKIDWTPSTLLKKQIQSITLHKLHLVIDPTAPALPPKEGEDQTADDKKKPLSHTLDLLRNILKPTQISITDLNIQIIDTTTVSLGSLTHPPGSDDYLLTDLRTKDHLDRAIHNPATTLTWTAPGFALDQVTLLPKLSLKNLIFHPDQKASGEILIAGNQLTLSSDLKKAHRITLNSPDLKITTIAELVKPDLIPDGKAKGTITALEIDTSKGLINLQGRDLQWDDQKLASVSIAASTPDLLSPLDQPIEIQANLENRLTIAGTITPHADPLHSKANLTFTLQDPAIPTISGNLTYASRAVHLQASALDHLSVIATYFLDSSTYTAEATSNLQDASQLDKKLTGLLAFSLTAKGDLKNQNHTGTLNLDHLQLNQPQLPTTTTAGVISYDWPKKITVTDLTITSPEADLKANLTWQDDILTISQLDLIENGTKLLTATAKLPAPLKTRSLDEIINSTAPLSLTIKSQPLRLKKLASFAPIPANLSGIFTADLSLSGSLAKPTLNGFASLDTLRLTPQPDVPPLDLELTFKTKNQKLFFTTSASEPRGLLLNIDGDLPFLPRTWLEGKTNPENIPINLRVYSPSLDLARLSKNPALPQQISGILKTDLTLAGTLANPSLNGSFSLDSFRLANQPDLPPLNLNLNVKTQNQSLLLTANATEPGGPLLNINGKLPFLPRAWINRKKNPSNSPIDLQISSPDLDLRRIQPFLPIIKKIEGNLKLDVLVSGTLSEPKYSGSAKARIAKMRIAGSPISDFQNTNFDITFKEQIATIQPSQITASGGTAKVSGSVNLAGTQPIFDIDLNGRYILLYRAADYSFRGHTALKLTGPLSAATISGKVELTESLFYKDLEILPFGVPRTTTIPEPNLPRFSKAPSPKKTTQNKPGGITDWKLNIAVTTLDPILIRGNLVRGKITGNVLVSGTIGNPKTTGTLVSEKLNADLPFSNLQVQTGVVTLRPDSLTNPLINLRGSSTIGQYTVQVFLTGPVQNPNLILTSAPPLPEPEIMLLLATGSASAQLEDRQVASQKALQYLLEGLRRRNRGKDKSVLQRLLKNSDQIELSLGDTNQFSGRRYSSATMEIDDQWDFTTQIDDQGQTRALLVFSIRFR